MRFGLIPSVMFPTRPLLNSMRRSIRWFWILLLALGACNSGGSALSPEDARATAVLLAQTMVVGTSGAASTATALARPSDTPLPPTNTATLTPTITLSPTATETATATSFAGHSPNELRNYYLIADDGGPVGCGDTLAYVYIGILPSGDIETDVRVTLEALFRPKGQYPFGLYNPLWASNITIQSVTYNPATGTALVDSTGDVGRGDPGCEWDRIRVQVNTTASHIPGPGDVEIKLNGRPFNDWVSSDRP